MTPRGRHEGDKPRRVQIPKLKGEPARVRGAIVAVLALLASVGVGWAADVKPETIAAIATVVTLIGPVLAEWIRPNVTANARVVAAVSEGTDGVVAGDAALVPTGTPLATQPGGVTTIVGRVAVDPSVLSAGGRRP